MPVEQLTEADRARARTTFLWDGVFARLMDTLTGGVFLAGLGLFVGADNFTIGLLASLPFFAQVAQLPAVKLLLHVTHRRQVVVLATALGRMLLAALAVLLVVRGPALGAPTLVATMTLIAVLAVIATAAWNWWVRDVIPRDELGRYFSRRLRWTAVAAAMSLVAAGYVLDRHIKAGRAAEGYALLFALGAIVGIVSTVFLAITPHPYPRTAPEKAKALPLMLDAVRQAPNRRLLVALSLVASTLTIALPFTAVYLLRSLEYDFVRVTALALVSQVAYVGSLRGWGHLSDRFGNRAILQISAGILVVALVGWGIAWGDPGAGLLGWLVALHFLTGFAVGGLELTSANVLLKTAPEANAPAYLAAFGLVRALVAGLATLAAGAAWQAMGSGPLFTLQPWPGAAWTLRGFHLLALASALVGVAGVLALRRVSEEGGAPAYEVARAMRREVRMISSVAGIRAFVHVVSYVVEFLATPAPQRGPLVRRRPAPPTKGPKR